MLAKGIVEDRHKVAFLLHTSGQEVQDLYYTLAGPEEELRDYKDVVELLDSYFVPKLNVSLNAMFSGKWTSNCMRT